MAETHPTSCTEGAFAWHLGVPLLKEMWIIDCLCVHSMLLMNCYTRPIYGIQLHLN